MHVKSSLDTFSHPFPSISISLIFPFATLFSNLDYFKRLESDLLAPSLASLQSRFHIDIIVNFKFNFYFLFLNYSVNFVTFIVVQ